MSKTLISLVERRYGKALFRASDGDLKVGRGWLGKLEQLAQVFEEDEVRRVLVSPVMPADLKRKILQYVLKKVGADESLGSFIEGLVDSGRVKNIPGIVRAFQNILDEKEGLIRAEVYSAVKLSKADLDLISESLQTSPKQKVILEEKENEALVAGIVVRMGNQLLDLSLATRLQLLAKQAVL